MSRLAHLRRLALHVPALIAALAFGAEEAAAQSNGVGEPRQVIDNNGTSPGTGGRVSAWDYVAPPGGLSLYVAPSTQGSGNCLSRANACTLATACRLSRRIATFLGPAGPIYLADGTYTGNAGTTLCDINGDVGGNDQQLISISGNRTRPTNVVVQVPDNGIGFNADDKGYLAVDFLQINGGNNSIGLAAGKSAVADYSDIYWGSWGSGGSHIVASGNGATINQLNNEYLTSNFSSGVHWDVSGGGSFNAEGTSHIDSAIAWSTFLSSSWGLVTVNNWKLTGAGVSGSTGQRAVLSGPGYLLIGGSCNSVLPGNSGCVFRNGFQDSNGDGTTGEGITVAQAAPTIYDPVLGAHIYAGLPASPKAGQQDHIVDGKAANCGDGSCTTWGTTVNGGDGALDLEIRFNGTNWTLVGK